MFYWDDVYWPFQETMKRIKEKFEEQEQLFSTRSTEHGQKVVELLAYSRWQLWCAAVGAMGVLAALSVVALVFLVGRTAAWIETTTQTHEGIKTPELLFLSLFFPMSMKEKIPAAHRTERRFDKNWIPVLCAAPIICILDVGVSALWSFYSVCWKKEYETCVEGENIARIDLQKHKAMWQGVRMSVDVVHFHFTS